MEGSLNLVLPGADHPELPDPPPARSPHISGHGGWRELNELPDPKEHQLATKTVDYYLERTEAEMDAADERIRSGTTGVIGVSGYPAYHASRANAYATMALAVASRDAAGTA